MSLSEPESVSVGLWGSRTIPVGACDPPDRLACPGDPPLLSELSRPPRPLRLSRRELSPDTREVVHYYAQREAQDILQILSVLRCGSWLAYHLFTSTPPAPFGPHWLFARLEDEAIVEWRIDCPSCFAYLYRSVERPAASPTAADNAAG